MNRRQFFSGVVSLPAVLTRGLKQAPSHVVTGVRATLLPEIYIDSRIDRADVERISQRAMQRVADYTRRGGRVGPFTT